MTVGIANEKLMIHSLFGQFMLLIVRFRVKVQCLALRHSNTTTLNICYSLQWIGEHLFSFSIVFSHRQKSFIVLIARFFRASRLFDLFSPITLVLLRTEIRFIPSLSDSMVTNREMNQFFHRVGQSIARKSLDKSPNNPYFPPAF
jgi:hypothetical protein